MRGSVFKRGRTWTYVLSLGREPGTDKKRQRWVGGFKTKADAELALTRALAAQDGGVTAVTTTTVDVAQFLDEWLEAVRPSLKVEAVKTHTSVPRLLGLLVIADLATGDCHSACGNRDEPLWRRTGRGRRARQYARIEIDDDTWEVLWVNAAERRLTLARRVGIAVERWASDRVS